MLSRDEGAAGAGGKMTLEYRCSKCGTLLQTTNADPLHDEIERLRTQCGGNCRYWEGRWRNADAEIERLRELKTPPSRELLNISKAALDSAEAEVERLRKSYSFQLDANKSFAEVVAKFQQEVDELRSALQYCEEMAHSPTVIKRTVNRALQRTPIDDPSVQAT